MLKTITSWLRSVTRPKRDLVAIDCPGCRHKALFDRAGFSDLDMATHDCSCGTRSEWSFDLLEPVLISASSI